MKKNIKKDPVRIYKYLILFGIIFVAAMLGMLVFYYGGFNNQPPDLSGIPEEPQINGADSVPAAVSQPTYRDNFDDATADQELAFTHTKELVQMYRAQNGYYPAALADLAPDFLAAEKLDPRYLYYVDLENDEFEMDMDLGPLATELMANDGGNDNALYEIGDNLYLH